MCVPRLGNTAGRAFNLDPQTSKVDSFVQNYIWTSYSASRDQVFNWITSQGNLPSLIEYMTWLNNLALAYQVDFIREPFCWEDLDKWWLPFNEILLNSYLHVLLYSFTPTVELIEVSLGSTCKRGTLADTLKFGIEGGRFFFCFHLLQRSMV